MTRIDDESSRDQRRNEEYRWEPEVKAQQRKRATSDCRQPLVKVPTADVVVVNPTHFAVALRYDKSEADAPGVVAKGVDFSPLGFDCWLISTRYRSSRIHLWRGLYFQTKEGHQIHPDFYAA